MTPTRYQPLGLEQIQDRVWSFFDCSEPGRPARVGPFYKTKAEALADLPRYAFDAGWSTEPVSSEQELRRDLAGMAKELDKTRAAAIAMRSALLTLQTQLLPDAMCKEKGGLTAFSRQRCMAIVKAVLTAPPITGE